MSYVVLARKWRPQTFDDLIGQGHVSRTLGNAIAAGRVAHAFLFTGVRGVGKTTSARILAKALNCAKGPTASPCLECNPCREIGNGSDLDVLEIDGATYTGIDKVRELQESLPYRPSRDRFKIFIVDEVHMLSQAAWNAFLKTLEEPPPHVKFIFATTEAHKVPVTILSRCQRYDFKLIGTTDIAARLRHVLTVEKVEADDDAIRIVAREAAGSMRDAMSLLDQVIAWAGDEGLTGDAVARVLGVAERSVLHRLSAALIGGDAATCLSVIGEFAEQGFSLTHVARDFLQHLRDLVAVKVGGDPNRLDLADAELGDIRALASRAELDDLSRIFLGFSRAFDDVARSAQPRSAFEMALVRLAHRPPIVALDDLMSRLAELERRLAAESTARPGENAGPKGQAGYDPAAAPLVETRPARPPAAAIAPAPAPAPTPAPAAAIAPAPAPAPALATPHSAHLGDRPRDDNGEPPPLAPITNLATSPSPDAGAPMDAWRKILDRLAAEKPLVASVLEHGALLACDGGRIVLGYDGDSFALAQMTEAALLDAGRVATATLGCPTVVVIDTTARLSDLQTAASARGAERQLQLDAAKKRVAEHPVVAAAIELLRAELRDVRLTEVN